MHFSVHPRGSVTISVQAIGTNHTSFDIGRAHFNGQPGQCRVVAEVLARTERCESYKARCMLSTAEKQRLSTGKRSAAICSLQPMEQHVHVNITESFSVPLLAFPLRYREVYLRDRKDRERVRLVATVRKDRGFFASRVTSDTSGGSEAIHVQASQTSRI